MRKPCFHYPIAPAAALRGPACKAAGGVVLSSKTAPKYRTVRYCAVRCASCGTCCSNSSAQDYLVCVGDCISHPRISTSSGASRRGVCEPDDTQCKPRSTTAMVIFDNTQVLLIIHGLTSGRSRRRSSIRCQSSFCIYGLINMD